MNSKLHFFLRKPYILVLPSYPQFLAVVQHPTFVMTALSTAQIFYTFYSNTTAIASEITTQI